ncbi:MAG: alkaline phosphatase family protein [Opitutales bacterium]|nr:alkaline phosphatase family protein [Opitutales bacterium]
MRRVVLNVVGLSARDLESGEMPHIAQWAKRGSSAKISPAFPAVTCTAQSDYLTGERPTVHGIVGNGWYDRGLSEVHFWKQSNRLVQAPKVWDKLHQRSHKLRIANLFWWYNMGTTADISVTPRPNYLADGGKVFDIATYPYEIKNSLKADLGEFPFKNFWGPTAGLASSQWIAQAAQWIEQNQKPDLNLVYLPHLDYDLQRFGPRSAEARQARLDIDNLVGGLIKFFEKRGVDVLIVSEYAITEVNQDIPLNRILRKHGLLRIKEELGVEILDTFNSQAFAVVDHQVAHVIVQDSSKLDEVRKILENTEGVEKILDQEAQKKLGINHERSGDFIVVAQKNVWFSYYWWLDDERAPDYARTVDIHRKPGYDPAELLIDPAIKFPLMNAAWFLLKKRLGLRALLKLTPLTGEKIKGSHGRVPEDPLDWPVMIMSANAGVPNSISSTEVFSYIIQGF